MPGAKSRTLHIERPHERARARAPMAHEQRGSVVDGGQTRRAHGLDVDLEVIVEGARDHPVGKSLVEGSLLERLAAQRGQRIEKRLYRCRCVTRRECRA